MNQPARHRTKAEIAREYLQEQIVSGAVPAGAQITTRAVSEAIGMSETPVREAIRSLAVEGWLRHTAHQGTIVASLKKTHVAEIFSLRGLLNAHAIKFGKASFTAERLDRIDENIARSREAVARNDFDGYSALNREFHELLCNTPQAEWTYRIFSILQGQSEVFRHGFKAIPDGLGPSLECHVAIRDALRSGDFERAAELVNEDEVSAGERLLETLVSESGHTK